MRDILSNFELLNVFFGILFALQTCPNLAKSMRSTPFRNSK